MTDPLYKPFKITTVCRADIVQMLIDKDWADEDEAVKIALSFTDAEMEELGEKMGESYVGNQFWNALDILTKDIMENREENNK